MEPTLLERQKEYQDTIEQLCLMDDIFARVVFKDNLCVTHILSTILSEDVECVEIYTQHDLKNLHGRDIVMDIVVKLKDGRYINIEVQRSDDGAHPKRARYHGSMLDANTVLPKEMWKQITPACVIFITENDVLKGGQPIYHIRKRIDENGKPFHDETEYIYVNGSMQEDTPLGELVHDLFCTKADDIHSDILRKEVRYYKEKEGGKKEMCRIMDELVEKGEKDGIVKGKILVLLKLLQMKLQSISFDLADTIKNCSSEQLDLLAEGIFTINNEDDVYQLLAA